MRCCCQWGGAVGRRWNTPSGEWPEGPCRGCPTHGPDGGQNMDLCRKHRQEHQQEKGR